MRKDQTMKRKRHTEEMGYSVRSPEGLVQVTPGVGLDPDYSSSGGDNEGLRRLGCIACFHLDLRRR